MEGFTTPWCNKRTGGLPNSCPVGLQRCYSILPGSPPLGLHQAIALCWITCGRNPSLSCTGLQPPGKHHAGIPAPQPCWGIPATSLRWAPAWSRSRSSLGYPPSPEPMALHSLLSPCHACDNQPPPRLSGPAWLQLHVEQLELCSGGTGNILVETAPHISMPGNLPSGWSQPELYSLPR
jgi:hypothetical protein